MRDKEQKSLLAMICAYLLLLLIVLMVMFLVCGGTYVAVQQDAAATAVATSYAEVQVVVLRVWLCVLFFIYSL